LKDRFIREAQAAAKLDHPQIVPVYEAGVDGDLPYIVYAYCEGATLSAWQKALPELSLPRQAAEIVCGLADAVQYSHDKGILHRDLTPGNVLLTPVTERSKEGLSFVPKVSDYGLAKLLESDWDESASNTLIGTPGYMAPEQVQRGPKSSGALIDVYGLGAILYFLLTGRAPFARETPVATLVALREEEVVAPRLLRPSTPIDLETICLKCLDKDPLGRYQTAGQLRDDLSRFLCGLPVLARPASSWRRIRMWIQRNPVLSSLILAVVGTTFLMLASLVSYTLHVRGLSQSLSDQNQQLRIIVQERDDAMIEQVKAQKLAEQRAVELQQSLYTTQVNRAGDAWRRGDLHVMVDALKPFVPSRPDQPELREFAWHYLWQQHGVQELFRETTSKAQYAAAFSPDGSVVAFAGADSVVRLISTSQFRILHEFATDQTEINHILFGPQGDWLATTGDDGTVGIWELPSGRKRLVVPVFENSQAYQAAYFEDDDLLLVCGASPAVEILRLSTGTRHASLRDGHSHDIEALAISPDQRQLLTCGADGTAGLWNLEQLRLIRKLNGFERPVLCAAWSSDERVVVGSLDGQVQEWDVQLEKPLWSKRLGSGINSLIIATDDRIFAGDIKGVVTVIRNLDDDVGGASHLNRLSLHDNRIQAMAYESTRGLLATASRDREITVSRVGFVVPSKKELYEQGMGARSLFGRIAGPDRRGRTYQQAGNHIRVYSGDVGAPPDFLLDCEAVDKVFWKEDVLCATSHWGKLYRWETHDDIHTLDVAQIRDQGSFSVEWLSRDKLLVGSGPKVAIWNTVRREIQEIDSGEFIRSAPGGSSFVIAKRVDYNLLVYDAVSVTPGWSAMGHTNVIRDLKFNPPGTRLYSASEDGTIRVWDLEKRTEVLQLRIAESLIRCIAVTADECTLATADESGDVRLWDLRTGGEFYLLDTLDQPLEALEFSPDGHILMGVDKEAVEYRWSIAGNEFRR
jgi:WD40 repeat protein/serine/threonine protein kinase